MGFSSPKSVIFSFCAQTMPRTFLVDTTYTHIYVKQLAIKTKYFYSVDIIFNIGQWICSDGYFIWVVVDADHCQPLWAYPCHQDLALWTATAIHNGWFTQYKILTVESPDPLVQAPSVTASNDSLVERIWLCHQPLLVNYLVWAQQKHLHSVSLHTKQDPLHW